MVVQHYSGSDTDTENTVSIGTHLAASQNFKSLFEDGMSLVSRAAAYLDGEGREESRRLPRPVALACATESMRLTTRLMQIASWLLYQRAVNEGDMTRTEALAEKAKLRTHAQGLAAHDDLFGQLPQTLQELCLQSLRLQQRVQHLEDLIYAPAAPASNTHPLDALHQQLRQAFRAD